MKKKNVYILFLCVLIGFSSVISSNLFAQKFNNLDPVKYIQLPSMGTEYSTALVYILEEKDEANAAISAGFGKLTKKVDNNLAKKGMDLFAKEVLSNKQEQYDVWNLIPGDFTAESGNGKLRVIIAYLPDHMAKPMGEPMKNKNGEHVFSYRVKTKVMVYNDQGDLIYERDFGAVSGRGTSKSLSLIHI